jgi:DNA-directed RNA polymerase beta subunit/DNA-directed RNA polymerase beta' subunit
MAPPYDIDDFENTAADPNAGWEGGPPVGMEKVSRTERDNYPRSAPSAMLSDRPMTPQEEERRRIMRSLEDPRDMARDVVNKTVSALDRTFADPISGGRYRVERVGDLIVEDIPDPWDHAAVADTIARDGTYGPLVKGRFRILDTKETDADGNPKVVKEQVINLARVPTPTADRAYVVGGKKRAMMSQFRRLPGVFTRTNAKGETELEANLDPSTSSQLPSFKVVLDRTTNDTATPFKMRIGTMKSGDAWQVAKLLGADAKDLKEAVGEETAAKILKTDSKDRYEREMRKLYGKIHAADRGGMGKTNAKHLPLGEIEADLMKQFTTSYISPEVSKMTLGKETDRVDKDVLLTGFRRLQAVASGDEEEDDRESLALKQVMGPADLIAESVGRSSTVEKNRRAMSSKLRALTFNKDANPNLAQIVGPRFRKAIEAKTSTSMEQRTLDSTTPIDTIAQATTTTILGAGAIGSEQAIPDEAKLLNSGGFGFLDPLHTPESARSGVVLHKPMRTGVKTVETGRASQPTINVLTSEFLDRSGKPLELSSAEVKGKPIGLFDQYDRGEDGKIKPKNLPGGVVKALVDGQVKLVDPKEISVWAQDAGQAFDINSSLIPFANSISGGRVGYSSKQTQQSLPLKYREAPLVQVRAPGSANSMEALLGEEAGAVNSPVDGTIVDIVDTPKKRTVTIKPKDGGKDITLSVPHNIAMPGGSLMDSEMKVKQGDSVSRGQLIADSTFTKDGVMAAGTNLRVAYLPYYTSTFEDAIVLSKSAADKLTSLHMYEEKVRGKGVDLGKSLYVTRTGTPLSKEEDDSIGDDGIVKVGTRVKPGQLLVAGSRSQAMTGSDIETAAALLGLYGTKNKRGVTTRVAEFEQRWDHPVEGTVKRVEPIVKGGKTVGATVYVEAEEPFEVGDKIFGRHGNKGIVTEIIPDDKMPRTKDGKAMDVLLNPAGVVGRINPSQNFENFLGKVAEKKGSPEVVDNWKYQDNWQHVKDTLEKEGVADAEDLIDPVTGRVLKSVGFGNQYILKAKQQVEHKSLARGVGTFSESGSVVKGDDGAQALGELGVYALLAQDAREFLRDAQLNKSEDRPEVWDALRRGSPIPPAVQPPEQFQRFQDYLTAAGVVMERKGDKMKLTRPVTDDEVKATAQTFGKDNVLTEPWKTVRVKAKDSAEDGVSRTEIMEKGGLFDPDATAGFQGTKWSRFSLSTPIPNPTYEQPIMDLLGMSAKEYEDLRTGVRAVEVDGKKLTGARAVDTLLSKVNVDAIEAETKTILEQSKDKSERNRAYRLARNIKMLKENNLDPQKAYMRQEVLVLPARMRGVSKDESTGDLVIGDINYLYRDIALTEKALRDAKAQNLPDTIISELETGLYEGVRALNQVQKSEPLSPGSTYQGIFGILAGRIPTGDGGEVSDVKSSFAKKNLLERRQVMSARTVLTPKDDLDMDEVGVPRRVAAAVFEPLLEAEFHRNHDMQSTRGREEFKQFRDRLQEYKATNTPDEMIDRYLDRVVADRYVAVKRDPALHMFSFQGFKPVLSREKTVNLNPLVYAGFNADNDGDSVLGRVTLFIGDGGEVEPTTMDISCFPHVPGSERVSEKGTRVYDVPAGIRVPAIHPDGTEVLAEVTEWSVHEDVDTYFVRLASGRSMIVSGDHSLCTLSLDTMQVEKTRPQDAVGRAVPVQVQYDCANGAEEHPAFGAPSFLRTDEDTGWLIGIILSQGWIGADARGRPHRIQLPWHDAQAPSIQGVHDDIKRIVSTYTLNAFTFQDVRWAPRAAAARLGGSRALILEPDLAAAVADAVQWQPEDSARGYRLAPWVFTASRSFRRGLLSGIFDGRGGVPHGAHRKDATSLLITIPPDYPDAPGLARDVALLAESLGAGATMTNNARGQYLVTMANVAPVLRPRHPETKERVDVILAYSRKILGDADPVRIPVPSSVRKDLIHALSSLGATSPRRRKNEEVSAAAAIWYWAVKNRTAQGGWPTRKFLAELLEFLLEHAQEDQTALLRDATRWCESVHQSSVSWDEVVEVKSLNQKTTMYDLTVPGPYTFAMATGAYVWDTLAIYAPVSPEANREIRDKMLPSKNLFSHASHQVEHGISHEAILGLARMTKPPTGDMSKPKAKFASVAEAEKAFNANEIDVTDPISIGGQNTTLGRALINAALPAGTTLESLQAAGVISAQGDFGIDKKSVGNINRWLAVEHPNAYSQVANTLRKTGQKYATLTGSSIRLDDLKPIVKQEREEAEQAIFKAVAEINKETAPNSKERKDRTAGVFSEWINKVNASAKPVIHAATDNVNVELTVTGARIKPTQLQQVIQAPMAMTDTKGDVIPSPVMRSYSEGLDGGGYMASLPGARSGTVAKVQQVQEPGYLTKQVVNTVIDQTVAEEDCGTTRGVEVDLSRPSQDTTNRYLARDVQVGGTTYPRNTLLTEQLTSEISRQSSGVAKVLVRSPLTCQTRGGGVCQKCTGTLPGGKAMPVGHNFGITSAQAIGERSTQMMLSLFHEGGVFNPNAGTGARDVYKQASAFLRMPKGMNGMEAVVSDRDATVTMVKENKSKGGIDVHFDSGRPMFFKNEVKSPSGGDIRDFLSVGKKVTKGEILTEGVANPKVLLEATGDMGRVQNYIVDNLGELYAGTGVKRRNVEALVRGITGTVEVTSAGRSNYMPGQRISAVEAEDMAAKDRQFKFKPVLMGVDVAPKEAREDFLAHLNFNDIRRQLVTGAAIGAESDLHGTNPIPGLFYGVEFNRQFQFGPASTDGTY